MPLFGKKKRPSFEDIAQAVIDFLEADDWAAGKRVVEERRDLLLTDEADQVFAMLLEQARDDPQARRMLERHRDLLRRCRSEGVDAAFAPLLAPRGMPDVPPELLQRLLSVGSEEELKALLEEHPELLPLIGQMVQQALAGQSAGSGDDDELVRILTELRQPSRSALDMPRRVDLCRQALALLPRQQNPELWAALQNELANSLAQNPLGDRADNLEQAIHHYQLALEVRTREALPSDHRLTQRNLGNLYFGERRWVEALEAYQAAIAAGDDLLKAAHTEAGKRAEVGETAQLYARAAYCLLQLGQPAEALLMHERGKTRLLAEALALAEANTSLLLPEEHAKRQALQEQVTALQEEMALPLDNPRRRDNVILLSLLEAAWAELREYTATLQEKYPDFMPQGLDLPDLLVLVPEGGALVAPLITSQGSVVFVVPHGVHKVTEEHVIRLEGFKDDELQTLLKGPPDDPAWGGWMGAYFAFRRSPTRLTEAAWQAAIERFTGELWEALVAPVHERLQALGVHSVILMPAGGLQLLPLHAAWRMEDGKRRCLLDDYEVVYAPSGYALNVSRRRASQRQGQAAMVVGINRYADPNVNPLINAAAEAIGDLLGATPLLDAEATKETIQAEAAGKATLHLSCHGYFAWGDPLASGLVLHDAPLTLKEIISAMNLDSSRLVTLSACETGITEVRQSPDEYIGLPAGFLQAGAPAVVSTLWTVDDRSTALLMERFYRNHRERGMSLPAALREAQLWLRDATRQEVGDYYDAYIHPRMSVAEATEAYVQVMTGGDPQDRLYANPYYWAAFTFSGA